MLSHSGRATVQVSLQALEGKIDIQWIFTARPLFWNMSMFCLGTCRTERGFDDVTELLNDIQSSWRKVSLMTFTSKIYLLSTEDYLCLTP